VPAALALGVAGLAVLIGLMQIVVRADPRKLAQFLRLSGGGFVVIAGLALILTGRVAAGAPLIAIGITALTRTWMNPAGWTSSGSAPDPSSSVKSTYLDMRLDHQTGAFVGRVIAGRLAGRQLDDLDQATLAGLLGEIADDADSVRLLEAYLDRRHPAWREDLEKDGAAGPRSAAGAGSMSQEEAYKILGLQPGAGEDDIRAAHRRLMKQVHPDHGGTAFLAAQINEAKERLLGRHR